MLRVTSGTAKGKKLKIPDFPEFRAVQDKAKLAVFSILGEKIEGATCLDLYAGSGSLGIEALSRGAKWCDFVDENRKSEEIIKKNLQNTGFLEKSEVYGQDAVKFAANSFEKYDIIFVDPFYNETHFRFLFENLEKMLSDGGVIVFSHGKGTGAKDALANTKYLTTHNQKKYGNALITIIKKIPHSV